MAKEHFIDYYDLLDISVKANAEIVENAVRAQLRRYSPQNKQSADATKFELVKKAYLTLSNPKSRISYDAEYKRRKDGIQSGSHRSLTAEAMKDEIRKRRVIVTVLYERMLKKPQDPDMTGKEISAGVGVSFERLEFPLWFLRETGLISRSDVGDLRITAAGVEWLEGVYGVIAPSEGSETESNVAETIDADDSPNPDAAVNVSMLAAAEVAVSQ